VYFHIHKKIVDARIIYQAMRLSKDSGIYFLYRMKSLNLLSDNNAMSFCFALSIIVHPALSGRPKEGYNVSHIG